MFSTVWGDIRHAVRIMCRSRLFTATVVLTAALAIAANATIFTVVNAVMIRSLPFAEPSRIMQVAEKNDKLNLPTFAASVLNFLSWREQTQSFEQLAGVGYATFTLSGNGEPEQLTGNRISPVLTQVLGTRLIAGREFKADEEKPGGAAVAIIGEGLWKRRFASDPALVGRTISLDGLPTTIVGIAPAEGGDLLWCNARVSAIAFYERAGFRTWGEQWVIAAHGPHVVMWRRIEPGRRSEERRVGKEGRS